MLDAQTVEFVEAVDAAGPALAPAIVSLALSIRAKARRGRRKKVEAA
jgi:hypothetical protein